MPSTTTNGIPFAIAGDAFGEYPATSEDLADVLDPTYTDVTFNGSWTNFGAPYEEVSYAKVGTIVRLRGAAKHATTSTTGTIFTLPAGSRPAKQRAFITLANAGLAVITVAASGAVAVNSYLSSGNAGVIPLDSISFDVAA